MRVSDLQMFSLLLDNLQRARQSAAVAQQQVSSGKRVAQASDDPAAFGQIVLDNDRLARLNQWITNAQAGSGPLQMTDSTLGSVTTLLTRVKELALQLRNDTSTAADRASGAGEAKQLLLQLMSLANTTLNGQALFGGTSTHGRATGLTVGVPVTVTAGTNDTLQLSVDGTASGTVTLTAGSYSGAQLASMVQTAVNADPTLSAAGKSVTVTFDTDHLVIASNAAGAASTVQVTGGTGRSLAGFDGGSTTTGADPFALQAVTAAAAGNTGGATIAQGRVGDPTAVTLHDYLIKFASATAYNVYDVSVPPTVAADSGNTGGAIKTDARVLDPSKLTLSDYRITFTSDTQYTITNTTTGVDVSTGNTYSDGGAIDFDGLRVVLGNGQGGGPKSGDQFTITLSPQTVLANQTYSSGSAITFDGLSLAITNGTTGPAAGDLFSVRSGTQYQGNAGVRTVQVGDNQTIQTNLPGNQVFTGTAVDLFASLKNLISALRGSSGGGLDQAIADSDTAINQVVAAQAEAGALANRVSGESAALQQLQASVTQFLSQNQDADLVQAASELAKQQLAVQASAQVMTQLFQTSLLQFLR